MAIQTVCESVNPVVTNPTSDDSVLVRWEIDEAMLSDWYWRVGILAPIRGVTFTAPTNLYVSAHTTACSGAAAGTEKSGDGYARTPITFAQATDLLIWNPAQWSLPSATAEWPDIVALAIWDSETPGAGNYYAYGNFTETLVVPINKAIVGEAKGTTIGKQGG